jgi:hypothetical protein
MTSNDPTCGSLFFVFFVPLCLRVHLLAPAPGPSSIRSRTKTVNTKTQSGQGPQPKRATARTLLVRFPLVAEFLLEKQTFTHLYFKGHEVFRFIPSIGEWLQPLRQSVTSHAGELYQSARRLRPARGRRVMAHPGGGSDRS